MNSSTPPPRAPGGTLWPKNQSQPNCFIVCYVILKVVAYDPCCSIWPCTFCEARRASHCHSPQTTYSSKSTCCVLSAQKSAMHVVVYADRRTIQHSIVDIIDWSWSYWQIWNPSWHVECFWAGLSLHTNFRLLHLPQFCNNIHGGK